MRFKLAAFVRRSFAGIVVTSALFLSTWNDFKAQQPDGKDKSSSGPLTPKQAQAAFQIAPGLRMELVAAEPQVQSPVAMTFDEDGKLWVVEMPDYPNGPAPGKPPEGRVVILQDKDGDGFYEQRSIFADKLLFANGLLRWKDGVIVTQAPNIVFLRDTDQDGKADKQEVLYEGFTAENPQLRVSHPILGIDNWIYVANGLRGGKVKAAGQPDSEGVSLSGMDFRFDPISKKYEAISGMGQYGNTFDDWGNRFVCDNRHHLRHIVLPNHYIKRNPFLAVPAVVEDISELQDGPLNSGGKIYPLSKNWTTSNLHEGRFTAACGVYVYRSGLLPKPYQGSAFTCDPTGNLVHAETLEPKGATFLAKPIFKEKEFLATADDWCRPVFLTEGPEGALYMVDMYRAVIEHPQFMPPELKNRPDLLLGKEKGRIWRIVPAQHNSKPIRSNLSKLSSEKLVELLTDHQAWYRSTAQRLLLQRQDKASFDFLKDLLASNQEPRGRLLAAWLLEAMGQLQDTRVLQLLEDKHPRLRELAVLLAEKWFTTSKTIRKKVQELASDPDAKVRFQAALSLGEQNEPNSLMALIGIALDDAEDKWVRWAVASSLTDRATILIGPLLGEKRTPGRESLLRELANVIGGRGDPEEVVFFLQALGHDRKDAQQWQLVGLNGLAEGMGQRGKQLGVFLQALPKAKAVVVNKTHQLLTNSAALAKDEKNELSQRVMGIALLAHVPWETARADLIEFVEKSSLKEIRLAAVKSLAAHPQPEVATVLLKSWKTYTPPLRSAATDALLRQPEWTQALLAEIEAGRIKPGDLDAVNVKRLLSHKQPQISATANKLLKASIPEARQKILAQYQAALKQQGDAARGQKVFEKNCATCHRVGKTGVDIGPDISDSRTKTPEAFLADILNPNLAIDNNYVNYVVVTKNGRIVTGIIITETASSLTLGRANKETDVVLRQDIEEINSSGVSLMPEGLEQQITVAEMADLLSFLKNWRYLDGSVPTGAK